MRRICSSCSPVAAARATTTSATTTTSLSLSANWRRGVSLLLPRGGERRVAPLRDGGLIAAFPRVALASSKRRSPPAPSAALASSAFPSSSALAPKSLISRRPFFASAGEQDRGDADGDRHNKDGAGDVGQQDTHHGKQEKQEKQGRGGEQKEEGEHRNTSSSSSSGDSGSSAGGSGAGGGGGGFGGGDNNNEFFARAAGQAAQLVAFVGMMWLLGKVTPDENSNERKDPASGQQQQRGGQQQQQVQRAADRRDYNRDSSMLRSQRTGGADGGDSIQAGEHDEVHTRHAAPRLEAMEPTYAENVRTEDPAASTAGSAPWGGSGGMTPGEVAQPSFQGRPYNGATEIDWNYFKSSLLAQGVVRRISINTNTNRVLVTCDMGAVSDSPQAVRGASYWFRVGDVAQFERRLAVAQEDLGIHATEFVPVSYDTEMAPWLAEHLLAILPLAISIGIAVYFFRNSPLAKGMPGRMDPTGKAINRVRNVKTRFKDVAGINEVRGEMMEFVEFLKEPKKFAKLGARVPRGAILSGPPGTGKTLLARAMAGEANVPFFSISGSEFVEMFVGVGPARVRKLFQEARANAPCIIFLDEIDAVGRKRGGAGGGHNDERENTLNQLLVEMDGFTPSTGVIVLAGTNRPDVLDPALMRPGRFDRQIQIDLPSIRGRKDIFDLHLKPIRVLLPAGDCPQCSGTGKVQDFEHPDPHACASCDGSGQISEEMAQLQTEAVHDAKASPLLNKQHNLTDHDKPRPLEDYAKHMATMTTGFSGADVANVCNEGALIAAREQSSHVTLYHLEAALERVIGGMEQQNRVMNPRDRNTVAYHESGHAVCGWFLKHADPLIKVSIVPRGVAALGYAQYRPNDQALQSKAELLDKMCTLLGGRVAEEVMLGTITTGAQNDLERLTQMAYGQVAMYGMNPETVGLVSFPPSDQMRVERKFSQETAEMIDDEVQSLVAYAYDRTRKLIVEQRDNLEAMARLLLEKEVLQREDLVALLGERPGADEKWSYDEIVADQLEREKNSSMYADDNRKIGVLLQFHCNEKTW